MGCFGLTPEAGSALFKAMSLSPKPSAITGACSPLLMGDFGLWNLDSGLLPYDLCSLI